MGRPGRGAGAVSRLRALATSGLGRATGWVIVVQVGGFALLLLRQIVFARILGRDGFGIVVYAMSFAQLAAVAATVGVNNSLVPVLARSRDDAGTARARRLVRRLVGVSALAGLAIGVVGAAATLAVGGGPSQIAIAAAWLFVPGLSLLSVLRGAVQGLGRVTVSVALAGLVPPTVALIVIAVVTVLATPTPVWGVVALGLGAVTAVVALAVVTERTAVDEGRRPSSEEFRAAVVLGLRLLAASAFSVIIARIDVLMIGVLASPADAGVYFAAARVISTLGFVASAVSLPLSPRIAERHASGDAAVLRDEVRAGIAMSLIPAVPLAVVLVIGAPLILDIFGPGFDAGAPVVAILAVANLASIGAGPVGYLLGNTGHERQLLKTTGWTMVLDVVLNLALIPPYGITGAALATGTTLIVQNLWQRRLAERALGLRFALLRRRDR